MARLEKFSTPAGIKDLGDGSLKQVELEDLWNATLDSFTETSINGGTPPLDNDRTFYFNPLHEDLTGATTPPPVAWTAFPNRILRYFPNASEIEKFRYADDGPPGINSEPYTPEGPRGWQDEYCEWSVTRRPSDNKITKVSFTCENREYWNALWLIDPDCVLKLYQELVDTRVQLSDLQGEIDEDTGYPSYNYLNKWNYNTTTGAVHLISGPNTLSAQIYLAAAATIVRQCNGTVVTNQDTLIKCSRYGRPGRNSDPLIGGKVNEIIRGGQVKVTLKDPVGLYIQTPSFSGWELPSQAPSNAQASDYWKIVRGNESKSTGEPDFILHAVYEVPATEDFCVGDIKINDEPIRFGSQIAQQLQIALVGIGINTNEVLTLRRCIDSEACRSGTSETVSAAIDPVHLRSMKSLISANRL
ncbi:MAG: hypothetical protein F6K09_01730 [Merismopedia sp. SIO2A8]|nr:hypothetical protein [Symploca sp. SIO2B6]NET47448.1 hypothetical protein [Merismopedia sp. SIO2A8]